MDDVYADDTLHSDVVFYGKLLSKTHLSRSRNHGVEQFLFSFAIDTVLAGYPE